MIHGGKKRGVFEVQLGVVEDGPDFILAISPDLNLGFLGPRQTGFQLSHIPPKNLVIEEDPGADDYVERRRGEWFAAKLQEQLAEFVIADVVRGPHEMLGDTPDAPDV